MTITYRGCRIVTDKDECGSKVVYVYMNDGSDPIEVIGASIERAKSLIDECLNDLEEASGDDEDDWGRDWCRGYDSSRERFHAD